MTGDQINPAIKPGRVRSPHNQKDANGNLAVKVYTSGERKSQNENYRNSNASTSVTNKAEISKSQSPKMKMKSNHLKLAAEATKTDKDGNEKDEFGIIKKLRNAITKRYEIVELIGNGSYGVVSKGKCKVTGRSVALKILKSQPKMEYEIIKLLREL